MLISPDNIPDYEPFYSEWQKERGKGGRLAIGVIVLAILTKALGMYYLISNLFAIGVVVLWNYLISANLIWIPITFNGREG